MYREHAKFGLGAQSINLTSLNIYTDTVPLQGELGEFFMLWGGGPLIRVIYTT